MTVALLLAALAGALWPQPGARLRTGADVVARLPAAGVRSRRTRRWLHRGADVRTRAAVVELCAALGAELRAGRTPRAALAAAVRGLPLPPVLQALGGRHGGPDVAAHVDVARLLREAAACPGAAGLRGLAACWEVSERTGAGLAAAVLRLGDALRDDEQVRREVAAQLAGPRATAVLLAALPGVGMLLGASLGVEPWAVLTGTPVGLACLVVGLLLEMAGLVWTGRIVRSAQP